MKELQSGLEAELASWNEGRGIDLRTWIACEGNIRLAIGYTTVFWPEFVEFEGYILRKDFTVETLRLWEKQPDLNRAGIEGVMNHLHIADIHCMGEEDLTPDRLLFLGSVLREIYTAKLNWQFPDRSFEISFVIPEDKMDFVGYELSFWQK